jgi:hypothetical protein
MSITSPERPTGPAIEDDLSHLEHQFAPVEPYTELESGIYVPIPKKLEVITGCSDDRPPTEESADYFEESYENTLPINEGYARIWGGKWGITLAIMATGAAAHGEDFIQKAGGFEGILAKVERVTDKRAVGHSAEGNEDSPVTFCMHGNKGLGCLACAAMGTAVSLLFNNELVINTAAHDQQAVMGETDSFERSLQGFKVVKRELARTSNTGMAEDFEITRERFAEDIEDGGKVMILAGKHARARDTEVVLNFEPDVSNPTEALRLGAPLYSVDLTTVAKEVAPLIQEYDLGWKDFMSSVQSITTPVRGALVAHDTDADLQGKIDPSYLKMSVRGDANEAIDRLEHEFGND